MGNAFVINILAKGVPSGAMVIFELLKVVEDELVLSNFQYDHENVEEDANEHHNGAVEAAALTDSSHLFYNY